MSENKQGIEHAGEVRMAYTPPIHDPIERRAIALRLAVDSKTAFFDAVKLAVPGPVEYARHILEVAEVFEEYIAGK